MAICYGAHRSMAEDLLCMLQQVPDQSLLCLSDKRITSSIAGLRPWRPIAMQNKEHKATWTNVLTLV